MRTRFTVLATVAGGCCLVGCSSQQPTKVAVSPTVAPQITPPTSPTVYSPPVQIGPPPGVTPAGPLNQNLGPQPVVLPSTVSELAGRKVPYFTHLRETINLFNVALRQIDAATNLKAADYQRADAAVQAFDQKVAKPPSIPVECQAVNGQLVSASESMKQVIMVLRPSNPAGLAKLDEAMGHLDLAVESMNGAMKEAETAATQMAR